MDFAKVRRVAITALFSDDDLFEQLVLKGGNALSLVYGLSSRTSLDLDFSMNQDFPDVEQARQRISRALKDRFDSHGFVVFDVKLEAKPSLDGKDTKPWWGGYELKFKLIGHGQYERFKGQLEKLRINALVIGAPETQERTFKVDLSKFEYTEGKAVTELDDFTIYVYTPEMIVVEKLRAICQQMPEYVHRGRAAARARDFYDIHLVTTALNLDVGSPQNRELTTRIFAAKRVPLSLLSKIQDQREFHRPDWPAVENTVDIPVREFDYYFDHVLSQVERLKSLWVEQPPI